MIDDENSDRMADDISPACDFGGQVAGNNNNYGKQKRFDLCVRLDAAVAEGWSWIGL